MLRILILSLLLPLQASAMSYKDRAVNLAARVPGCDVKAVYVANFTSEKTLGKYHRKIITIKPNLPRKKMIATVVHECMHRVDEKTEWHSKKKQIFGRPPYVTSYAKKNRQEDFAETATVYLIGDKRRISDEKRQIIRSLLRR